MIEKIRIHNFQAHHKLEIVLDPFITCLVGESDAGKSSCLRALRWLGCNRPGGSAFMRSGHQVVSVRLFVDGHTIDRAKGRKGNVYRLDGHSFRAIGSGPPPETIASILNIGPDSWQLQHSPPFWLSLSPGQLAKELNRIVSLDLIDRSLAYLSSELRHAKTAVEISEDRLKEAQQKQEELAWIPEAERELSILEEQEQELDSIHARMDGIESLLVRLTQAEEVYQNASQAILDAARAIRIGEKIEKLTERLEGMEHLLRKLDEQEESQCQAERQAQKAEKELTRALKGVCPICLRPLPTAK